MQNLQPMINELYILIKQNLGQQMFKSLSIKKLKIKMVFTMSSLHCLVIFSFWLYTVVQAPYKNGDIILAGLFNVHKLKGDSEGQCGEIDTHGIGRAEAMIFAIEKINNDSNLLPNISLGYDIRDYCENVTKATRLTYELFKDHCGAKIARNESIIALIGPFESRTALVIGGFLQMLNVSAISGTTVSPELSSFTYKHLYRTVPPDTFLAKAIADTIVHFNWSYIAVVGLDDSYGRNGIWSLVSEAASRKSPFCIAFTEFIPHETQFPSMSKIVTKLKKLENIKVVVLWIYGSYQNNFFVEVNRQNLTGRIWVLSEIYINSNPNLGKFSSSDFSSLHGSIGFQPHNFKDGGFQKHIKDLLINDRDKENKQNVPEWWNEIKDLKCSCLTRTNKTVSKNRQGELCSQAVIDRIYNPFIPYTMDAVYSLAHALEILMKDANMMAKWRLRPNLNIEIQSLFRRVAFTGLTGTIKFNRLGDRDSAYYDIVNLQQGKGAYINGINQVRVGEWQGKEQHGEKLRFYEKIQWNTPNGKLPKSECLEKCSTGTRKSITSPCCWQCIPCPNGTINPTAGSERCTECPRGKRPNEARTECIDLPLANFTYSSVGGAAILVLVACGIVVIIFSLCVMCRFWDTPIVKASNRELSLFLLGTIPMLLFLAFMNLLEPSDLICKIIYSGRYITYNLCLSFLLVKVLLISSAFEIPIVHDLTVGCLSVKLQAVIVLALHVLLLLLLLPWFLLDPPITMEQIVLEERYTFIECKGYSVLVGKCFFLLTCSFIFFHMSVCTFCFFKVRNIPENFSEAKRIAFSMYIFFVSILAYHPVEFFMDGRYVTVVDCVTTLLSAYGFLCCIFLPKIYIILFRPELNTLAIVRQEVTQFSFGSSSLHVNPTFESCNHQLQR